MSFVARNHQLSVQLRMSFELDWIALSGVIIIEYSVGLGPEQPKVDGILERKRGERAREARYDHKTTRNRPGAPVLHLEITVSPPNSV